MKKDEMSASGTVKCECGQITSVGSYEVADNTLTLSTEFGVFKTNVGLSKPQRLAHRMHKNICTNVAARRHADVADATVPEAAKL